MTVTTKKTLLLVASIILLLSLIKYYREYKIVIRTTSPISKAQDEITDLCAGLITDKLAHPMTALAKPPLYGTVIDPQFGTTIRRITAVPTSEGGNAVIKPMYATVPAWNADESKLILWHQGHDHELYDGKTYQFTRELPLESPTDLEQVLCDPVYPDIIYYPSNYNAQPRFMRYRVSTNTNELVRNFGTAPTNCPVDWGKLLAIGSDPQYFSWGPAKVIG